MRIADLNEGVIPSEIINECEKNPFAEFFLLGALAEKGHRLPLPDEEYDLHEEWRQVIEPAPPNCFDEFRQRNRECAATIARCLVRDYLSMIDPSMDEQMKDKSIDKISGLLTCLVCL